MASAASCKSVTVVLAVLIAMVLPLEDAAGAATYPLVWELGWGTSGSGNNQFSGPNGIGIDNEDHVFVADSSNARVTMFDRNGSFIRAIPMRFGQYFNSPQDVAADSSGHIYVATATVYDTVRVEVYDATNGGFVRSWAVNDADGVPLNTRGIAVRGNLVYVSGTFYDDQVLVYTTTGVLVDRWGTSGSNDGEFNFPTGIATDSSGNVYVADSGNHRIQKFDSTGRFLDSFGTSGAGDGQFAFPRGIAVDASDNVYVVDTGNDRIQQFDTNGSFVTKWGSAGSGHGQFSNAVDTVADSQGRVFVLDSWHPNVQRFGPAPPPAPPVNLSATPGNARVDLSWNPPTTTGGLPLARYNVYRDGALVGSTQDGVRTSFTDTGLTNGTTYGYQVSAVTEAGESAPSATVPATPREADPRPDGWIRTARGHFVGNNIYNATGAGQTVAASAYRTASTSYFAMIQNDAPYPDQMLLRGTASNTRFRVKYTHNGLGLC